MAGFESACHINRAGQRLDMIAATQHDLHVDEDYARLESVGISTVRDGFRWPLIERSNGHYDFSSALPMVEAAQRHGIQVIWNICHYGWPDDLDLFDPAFVSRFARYCEATAKFIRDHTDAIPFYIPINEISFLAWAAGEVAYIHPCEAKRGGELKRHLIRAVIAGCEAIWGVDPRARMITIEPLIHIIAPPDRPDLVEIAARERAGQFEAWDMLSGRLCPELGGHPRYLDIIAVNYYHANQWEYPDQRLRWEDTPRDVRWVPLHQLLAEVYHRYERPLFIGETSHFGAGRAAWLREIADEARKAVENGVPLDGICIYPIIDRPDWDNLEHWHNSGLWDIERDESGYLKRKLVSDYAAEFERLRQI